MSAKVFNVKLISVSGQEHILGICTLSWGGFICPLSLLLPLRACPQSPCCLPSPQQSMCWHKHCWGQGREAVVLGKLLCSKALAWSRRWGHIQSSAAERWWKCSEGWTCRHCSVQLLWASACSVNPSAWEEAHSAVRTQVKSWILWHCFSQDCATSELTSFLLGSRIDTCPAVHLDWVLCKFFCPPRGAHACWLPVEFVKKARLET